MDAARLREILKTEYGINDDEELYEVASNSAGINIGIFTTPLVERSGFFEQKAEAQY